MLYRTLVISSILKYQQQNPMDHSIALTCILSQGRLLLPAGIFWCGVAAGGVLLEEEVVAVEAAGESRRMGIAWEESEKQGPAFDLIWERIV